MSRSPFKLLRPFAVSFSDGRTSAYMLRRILDAHDGWPADAICCFANTGRERDETLDFVRDCQERWSVPVRWLERTPGGGFREVGHATAHRIGTEGPSPFDVLIGEREYLPNPTTRYCTGELKIRTIRRFLASQGWDGDFHRRHGIGIRADEADRTIQILADSPSYSHPVFPLVSAGVDKAEVMRFWRRQPFDLALDQSEGNCDFCFLKSKAKLVRLIRARPGDAGWWLGQERSKEGTAGSGSKFREDRTFAELAAIASQPLMFEVDDETEYACQCTAGVGDYRNEDTAP